MLGFSDLLVEMPRVEECKDGRNPGFECEFWLFWLCDLEQITSVSFRLLV